MADTDAATLDVRRMRVLREVAARGTIAAAARALAFTPSAVSQQLAALEREAGVALLDRRGGRVHLTEAGRRLVGRTEAILAELEAATAELRGGRRRGHRRRPRRARFPSAERALLAPAIATLAARHAEVRVRTTELEPEDALPALRLGDVDLAISHEDVARPARPTTGSSARTCWTTRCGSRSRAAGSPASRIRRGITRRARRPRRCALGRHAARAPPAGRWSTTPAAWPASSPTRPTTPTTSRVLAAFVAAGLGVAMVPGLALPAFGGPEVGIHRVADVPVTRRIFAAARRGGLERPAAAAMVARASRGGSDAHAQRQVIRERRGVEHLDLARSPVGEEVVDVMAADVPDSPGIAGASSSMSPPNSSGAPSAHSSAVAAAPSRSARRCSGGCVEAWRFTTQPPPAARSRASRAAPAARVSSRVRCSPIAPPAHQDRVAAAAVRREQVRVALRERAPGEAAGSCARSAPSARPPRWPLRAGAATTAAPPGAARRPSPTPRASAELDEQRAPRCRVGAPVEQVPAQHEHGARRYRV